MPRPGVRFEPRQIPCEECTSFFCGSNRFPRGWDKKHEGDKPRWFHCCSNKVVEGYIPDRCQNCRDKHVVCHPLKEPAKREAAKKLAAAAQNLLGWYRFQTARTDYDREICDRFLSNPANILSVVHPWDEAVTVVKGLHSQQDSPCGSVFLSDPSERKRKLAPASPESSLDDDDDVPLHYTKRVRPSRHISTSPDGEMLATDDHHARGRVYTVDSLGQRHTYERAGSAAASSLSFTAINSVPFGSNGSRLPRLRTVPPSDFGDAASRAVVSSESADRPGPKVALSPASDHGHDDSMLGRSAMRDSSILPAITPTMVSLPQNPKLGSNSNSNSPEKTRIIFESVEEYLSSDPEIRLEYRKAARDFILAHPNLLQEEAEKIVRATLLSGTTAVIEASGHQSSAPGGKAHDSNSSTLLQEAKEELLSENPGILQVATHKLLSEDPRIRQQAARRLLMDHVLFALVAQKEA
jgi:hypothetical protein